MKHLFSFMLLAFSATAFSQSLFLDQVSVKNLNLNQNEIEIAVSYPGAHLSGICGVEIRTSSNMTEINKLIKIERALGIDPVVSLIHETAILVDLTAASDMYMTSFKISTVNGKTFKDNFAPFLIHGEKIVLITRTCP